MITRRRFIQSVLAASIAPVFIKSSSLMGLYIPHARDIYVGKVWPKGFEVYASVEEALKDNFDL